MIDVDTALGEQSVTSPPLHSLTIFHVGRCAVSKAERLSICGKNLGKDLITILKSVMVWWIFTVNRQNSSFLSVFYAADSIKLVRSWAAGNPVKKSPVDKVKDDTSHWQNTTHNAPVLDAQDYRSKMHKIKRLLGPSLSSLSRTFGLPCDEGFSEVPSTHLQRCWRGWLEPHPIWPVWLAMDLLLLASSVSTLT